MREIKFRAWDKTINTMRMNVSLDLSQNMFRGVSDGIFPFARFDEVELMQFTGLKDKNGVEIYEGDILKAKYNSRTVTWAGGYKRPKEPDGVENTIFKVEKRAGYFRLSNGWNSLSFEQLMERDGKIWESWEKCHKNNFNFDKNCVNYTDFEVIGNIYENPELL